MSALHKPEQQSALSPQALPEVEQDAPELSPKETQVPLSLQVPLQHSELSEHSSSSMTQASVLHIDALGGDACAALPTTVSVGWTIAPAGPSPMP